MGNVSEKLRKELSKQIGSMADSQRIDFQEYLERHMLNGLSSAGSKGELWKQGYKEPLTSLVIGGYGNPNEPYGAGPTRAVDHATYAIRVTVAQEGVPLTKGIFHKHLKGFNAVMYLLELYNNGARDDQKNQRYRKGMPTNPFTVVSKWDIELNGEPTFLELLLANVSKNGSYYQGDVAIYLGRHLGSGLNYLSNKELYGDLQHSRETRDILLGRTPIAAPFRGAVIKHAQDLSEIANNLLGQLPENNRKHNVMLTVDNV